MTEQDVDSRGSDTGVLYVVATPIGNLGDISRRAVDVLRDVALIAAEDTRRSLALLRALGLPRPQMLALHDHNEAAASRAVGRTLARGESAALISDAGTPLLSDPGFELVRSCFERGIPVRPVPGPSAVVAALSVCPLPTTGCRFVGFLPGKGPARRVRLTALVEAGDPVVFFEAPHRLRECLRDLEDIAPRRRLFVAREMTKVYESYRCGPAGELIEQMDAAGQWRGEVVCVLEGEAQPRAASETERLRVMRILLAELAPAQAARLGAQLLGEKRGAMYDVAQRLKGQGA